MESDQSSFKVLLVDDRSENLMALEAILNDENYHLVKANSGKEALSYLLSDLNIHLIIMDVVMPVMNGFETAELIYSREKLKNIPIIFLTALDIEGNIYKGYKAGAIDYISKPVIPELLKVKVKAFVELSEKNRELLKQEQKLLLANKKLEKEITERTLSEAKIKLLNDELSHKLEQLQSLDDFNYSVSHDLMSPLNSIMGLAGLLQSMHPAEVNNNVLEVVDQMVFSANKMAKLIKNLLSFSRQANTEINKTACNMGDLVSETIRDMANNVILENTELVIQDHLPRVSCDCDMIKQVWTNLISNAIKYSRKTERPKIEIGSCIEDNKTVFFIKDNGAGFDMKHYDKLFAIFQRLHNEKDFSGTGVGLAIVKRIIARHNGRIWAESEPGVGSTFYFTIGN